MVTSGPAAADGRAVEELVMVGEWARTLGAVATAVGVVVKVAQEVRAARVKRAGGGRPRRSRLSSVRRRDRNG
jgi:hypothetical protein